MPDSASTIRVSRAMHAPADHVWTLITDVTRMGEWSPETTAAEWLGDASGPTAGGKVRGANRHRSKRREAGAKFRGTNRNGSKSWKSVATVVDATPGRAFTFRVKALGLSVAEWGYTI